VLRRVFGPKREDGKKRLGKLYLTMSFIICTLHQILLIIFRRIRLGNM
jgi:hypothetical protein